MRSRGASIRIELQHGEAGFQTTARLELKGPKVSVSVAFESILPALHELSNSANKILMIDIPVKSIKQQRKQLSKKPGNGRPDRACG
jgi:hypothetical protein